MQKLKYVLLAVVSVTFVLSHLIGVGLYPFSPSVIRPLHLMFLGIIFLLTHESKDAKHSLTFYFDLLLVIVLIFSTGNIFIDQEGWKVRGYFAACPLDVFYSFCSIVLVVYFTQRKIGWPIVLLTIGMFIYALFGGYIPGYFGTIPISFQGIMSRLYSVEEGLFGAIVGVSATYIFFFVCFGSLMSVTGVGDYFIEFAQAIAGKGKGAVARIACISSMIFGTISGSGAANVVATGTFTIPLMKKAGYKSHIAASIETISSTGGQIMPPIMSSAAFIMAEITGIPYLNICIAAVVPALLYYLAVFLVIQFESNKLQEVMLDQFKKLNVSQVLKHSYKLLPLITIIIVLVSGKSPLMAALWAMLVTILITFLTPKNRIRIQDIVNASIDASRNILPIGLACVNAGLIVGLLNITGLGVKFSSTLLQLSQGNVFLMLVLTMSVTIVLSMGLPVAASYIIAAAVCAPSLVKAGIPLIAAHLFIIHFASLSGITPPVAINAYTAAGISGSNPIKVAVTSCKLMITAFVIPYTFLYHPALLLNAPLPDILLATITAILGVGAVLTSIAYEAEGFNYIYRIVFFVCGLLLISPSNILGMLSLLIVASMILLYIYTNRNRRINKQIS